jgi:hypothetical protein
MQFGWVAVVGITLGCASGGAGTSAGSGAASASGSSEGSDELNLFELFGPECAAPPARLAELAEGPMPRVSEEQRFRYLLDCGSAGRLTPALGEKARPALLARGKTLVQQLEAVPPAPGVAWRWNEPYSTTRAEAEVLWDLLGFTGRNEEVTALLRRAESLPDPVMKLWSGVALLRLGQELGPGSAGAIAADADARNLFFDKLGELDRSELFPAAERTQAKFAESEMVHWLAFPTELGRVPDHIELMQTLDADLGPDDGMATYFVFRFKTDPPDQFAKDGWMAGVAGPFLRKDSPSTDAQGQTFSTFTAWETASAEEHLDKILEVLASAAAAH